MVGQQDGVKPRVRHGGGRHQRKAAPTRQCCVWARAVACLLVALEPGVEDDGGLSAPLANASAVGK